MDNRKIHTILQDALEEEIPSTDIHLWPDVQTLVAGEPPLQGVPPMNTPKIRGVPRVVLALFVVVALFALALATPQGRSFAQSIFQFFTRAGETSFPLSDSQIATEPETDSPTAEPPAPLITVAEAEAQAGFDVAELSFTPKGFTFLGARLYGNTIHLEYETLGHENQLFISQSQEGYMESDWNEVPEEYIVPVMIGDLPGEFVQGTFVVYPDATSATWNPDVAMLRLRWVANGVWFEIVKLGNVEPIEYLDQAGLIALAEDLMR